MSVVSIWFNIIRIRKVQNNRKKREKFIKILGLRNTKYVWYQPENFGFDEQTDKKQALELFDHIFKETKTKLENDSKGFKVSAAKSFWWHFPLYKGRAKILRCCNFEAPWATRTFSTFLNTPNLALVGGHEPSYTHYVL